MRRNIALSLVTLLAVSCGRINPSQKSPSETIISAYAAGNAGNYSEASLLCSKRLNKYFTETVGQGDRDRGLKFMFDEITNKGTLDHVEILKEEKSREDRLEIFKEKENGDHVTIEMKLHYKNGELKDSSATLVREDGTWKITV